jgi:salicylate hydroxylase
MSLRIAIAGVGVVGGVIATGLRHLPGLEITAVERVHRADHETAGNGLNVGPNAVRSLAAVMPEMAQRLLDASLPWRAWTTWTMGGEPLYVIPLEEVADRSGIRIRWAELYRVCREGAAAVTRFEAECEAARPSADTVALDVRAADGRTASLDGFDLVIACDGRFSRLREQLCGAPAVRHLGVANFRCLLPDEPGLGLDDLEQWYHGPHRLLAFRTPGGLVYLSGNFPIEPGADIAPDQKTRAWLRDAYTPPGTMARKARWLLDGACREETVLHWSRAQESDTRFADPSGRVLFVGDAAHAMAPTLGQGATMAIEDGAAFVDLFTRRWRAAGHHAGDFDVTALVAEYAALRAPRVDFVKRFSWDASDTLRPGADSIAGNRAKGGEAYRRKLTRLYMETPTPRAMAPA